ncbi:hypothetical protein [Paenirhodobacter populi]|uniref:Uncharacterized protein n=1 Tax=Paenirhodobacter populi TaxID=2306993 RepID=A0A443IT86_9RHOB|nr:hypothetical protein [Sinirhodobacter populi]RWR10450.1 hypothetical protein D2T33_12360 [Sinirhodobacter populi]
MDRTTINLSDPDYNNSDAGYSNGYIGYKAAASETIKLFRAGLGNMRDHNRRPNGNRLSYFTAEKAITAGVGATSGRYAIDDPLSVEFDLSYEDITSRVIPGRVKLSDVTGDPMGLRGGNFIILRIQAK